MNTASPALKPSPLRALWTLWMHWRGRRQAIDARSGASPCQASAEPLLLPPHQAGWLTLARGERLHLQAGQLLLSEAPRALDAWLALPAQPLRAGEVWVAHRAGRVLLQAGDQPVRLLRRAA